MTYEVISKMLKPADEPQSFGKKLLCTIPAGGMAGILNWVVGMPPDVLKSRLQTGIDKHFLNLLNITLGYKVPLFLWVHLQTWYDVRETKLERK